MLATHAMVGSSSRAHDRLGMIDRTVTVPTGRRTRAEAPRRDSDGVAHRQQRMRARDATGLRVAVGKPGVVQTCRSSKRRRVADRERSARGSRAVSGPLAVVSSAEIVENASK